MTLRLWLFIGLFLALNFTLIILRSREAVDDEEKMKQKTIKQLRQMQALNLRENSLMRKYEERLEEKVKYDKKYAAETIIMQAGFPTFSFAELRVLEYCIMTLFIILAFFVLENPILAVIVGIVGKLLPMQILSFIANTRMADMDKQVGSFIKLITERYEAHGDLPKAIEQTAPDFKGMEPMYSEIQRTILDMRVGTPTETSMKNLGRRTGNKFLILLSKYYAISASLGTEDARNRIVSQAWVQFNEDYKMKQTLREEIAGPKNEAYIMLAFVPIIIVYQIFTNADYLPFMLNTDLGKAGSAGILAVLLGCLWFINKKIGAPLD